MYKIVIKLLHFALIFGAKIIFEVITDHYKYERFLNYFEFILSI